MLSKDVRSRGKVVRSHVRGEGLRRYGVVEYSSASESAPAVEEVNNSPPHVGELNNLSDLQGNVENDHFMPSDFEMDETDDPNSSGLTG